MQGEELRSEKSHEDKVTTRCGCRLSCWDGLCWQSKCEIQPLPLPTSCSKMAASCVFRSSTNGIYEQLVNLQKCTEGTWSYPKELPKEAYHGHGTSNSKTQAILYSTSTAWGCCRTGKIACSRPRCAQIPEGLVSGVLRRQNRQESQLLQATAHMFALVAQRRGGSLFTSTYRANTLTALLPTTELTFLLFCRRKLCNLSSLFPFAVWFCVAVQAAARMLNQQFSLILLEKESLPPHTFGRSNLLINHFNYAKAPTRDVAILETMGNMLIGTNFFFLPTPPSLCFEYLYLYGYLSAK